MTKPKKPTEDKPQFGILNSLHGAKKGKTKGEKQPEQPQAKDENITEVEFDPEWHSILNEFWWRN